MSTLFSSAIYKQNNPVSSILRKILVVYMLFITCISITSCGDDMENENICEICEKIDDSENETPKEGTCGCAFRKLNAKNDEAFIKFLNEISDSEHRFYNQMIHTENWRLNTLFNVAKNGKGPMLNKASKVLGAIFRISTKEWNQKLKKSLEALPNVNEYKVQIQNCITELLKTDRYDGIIRKGNQSSSNYLYIDYLIDNNRDSSIFPTLNSSLGSILKFHSSVTERNDLTHDSLAYSLSYNNYHPQALIINVYGGRDKMANVPMISLDMNDFDRELIAANYAVARLKLYDEFHNDKIESQSTNEKFEEVIKSIKTFIDHFKSQKNWPKDLPIYLCGSSFGACTINSFMRNYPDLVKGAITWAGGYANKNTDNKEGTINPITNARKLKQGNLLLLHAWNDNNVSPQEGVDFIQAVKNSNVRKNFKIYPYLINFGETKLPIYKSTKDDIENLGHIQPHFRADIAREVNNFIEKTNKGGTARTEEENVKYETLFINLARLNNLKPETNLDELMTSMLTKWCQEYYYREHKNENFENAWKSYFLPKVIKTLMQLEHDTFELPVEPIYEAVKKAKENKFYNETLVNYFKGKNINFGEVWKTKIQAYFSEMGLDRFLTEAHYDLIEHSMGEPCCLAKRLGINASADAMIENQQLDLAHDTSTEDYKKICENLFKILR